MPANLIPVLDKTPEVAVVILVVVSVSFADGVTAGGGDAGEEVSFVGGRGELTGGDGDDVTEEGGV